MQAAAAQSKFMELLSSAGVKEEMEWEDAMKLIINSQCEADYLQLVHADANRAPPPSDIALHARSRVNLASAKPIAACFVSRGRKPVSPVPFRQKPVLNSSA